MLDRLCPSWAKRGEEPPGVHYDGCGLYLQVTKAGAKVRSGQEYAAGSKSSGACNRQQACAAT
jgi:hypothetical protein